MSAEELVPTVGVEEEYQLVDARSGKLRPDCQAVMESLGTNTVVGAAIQHELHLSQIEMASPICKSLDEVRRCLSDVRGALIQAAEKVGAKLVAAGTHPMRASTRDDVTPKERYQSMAHQYQMLARQLRIFGCHVHVGIKDRELAVQVMNRVTRWLPALQAISANSPFWDGQDSGYASYRRELWVQWPMAGPPNWFENAADLTACVQQMTQAGAIADATRIYWDVRLPEKTPTIEFRVMDVMTRIDETVAVVGLIRALVQQTTKDVIAGRQPERIRPELLRVALWQSARYGVTDHLLDPVECRQVRAEEHIGSLMDYVRDPLQANGDEAIVTKSIARILELGGGATRQRNFKRDHDLNHVVQELARETAP